MPPKSKQSSYEWNECLICQTVIHHRDLTKHKSQCADGKFSHPHITKAGVLHGVPCLESDQRGSKLQTSTWKEDALFLHPTVMQLCGFTFGGFCIVNRHHVTTVWPASSVSATSVVMTKELFDKLGCEKDTLIPVSQLQHVNFADELELAPRGGHQSLFREDRFMEFLSQTLKGRFVCADSTLNVSYFGQLYSFTVARITELTAAHTFHVELETNSNRADDLVDSVANLSVGSKSDLDDSLSLPESSGGCGCLRNSECPHQKLNSTPGTPVSGLNTSASGSDCDKQGGDDENSITTEHSTPKSGQAPGSMPRTGLFSPGTETQFCSPRVRRRGSGEGSVQFYQVVSTSRVVVAAAAGSDHGEERRLQAARFCDIGGLEPQIRTLREMIDTPIKSPDLFSSYGLPQPRGVLLFGPSGCGKSMLARAITAEFPVHVVTISGPEIWSKFYGETETKLRQLFQTAASRAPSIVVIDDVDALCPRRDATHSELEKRVVASFLTLMDGINTAQRQEFVMVVGTTSQPDRIDPALRRPGRFDREIEVGVPSVHDRRAVSHMKLNITMQYGKT